MSKRDWESVPQDRYMIRLCRLRRDVLEQSRERYYKENEIEPPPDEGFNGVSTVLSAKPIRRAVYVCAAYFRREFGFDFVQYSVDPYRGEDGRDVAFLWTGRHVDYRFSGGVIHGFHPVVGACSFRWREWTDAPAGYSLDFVWFHPYERRCGHLSRTWPHFVERFGRFHIEYPISPAMEGFLVKMGHVREPQ